MSTIGFDINQLGNIWHKAWESLGHDFLKDNGAAICAMNTINKCMIFIKKKRSGPDRGAELGSLSSGAKMAMKFFVKRVFTIFASNASFMRVIANLQN